jgi:hypothetical protein
VYSGQDTLINEIVARVRDAIDHLFMDVCKARHHEGGEQTE